MRVEQILYENIAGLLMKEMRECQDWISLSNSLHDKFKGFHLYCKIPKYKLLNVILIFKTRMEWITMRKPHSPMRFSWQRMTKIESEM